MAKFIEVTNYDDEKIFVNIDNILWVESSEDNASVIRLAIRGNNDYPLGLFVKESTASLMQKMNTSY